MLTISPDTEPEGDTNIGLSLPQDDQIGPKQGACRTKGAGTI